MTDKFPRQTRLSRQFAIQAGGGVLNVALFIGLTPIITAALGLDRYGVLLLVLSFAIYAGLAEFGLGMATSREVAAAEDAERPYVFGGSLFLTCAFGAFAGFLFSLLSLAPVGRVLGLEYELLEELGSSGWCLFFLGFGGVVTSVAQSALHGLSRFIELNVLSISGNAIVLLAPAAYAVTLGTDLPGILASVAIARFVTAIAGVSICLKCNLVPRLPTDRDVFVRLLSYGGWATIGGLLHRATNSIDRLVLSMVSGPTQVTLYAIPQGALTRAQFFGTALMTVAFPRLTREGRETDLARLCCLTLLALTPFFVAGIQLTPCLLELWLGQEFSSRASDAAVLLGVWSWLELIGIVPIVSMQAHAQMRQDAMIAAIILVPNFLLLGSAIYLLGIEGAAVVAALRSLAYLIGRARVAGYHALPMSDCLLNGLLVIGAAVTTIALDGRDAFVIGGLLCILSAIVAITRRPKVFDALLLELRDFLRRSLRESEKYK